MSPMVSEPRNIEYGISSLASVMPGETFGGLPPPCTATSLPSFPFLLQRARLAALAISLRSSGVRTFALALPPFAAPSFDNSRAALLLSSSDIPFLLFLLGQAHHAR